VIICDPNKTNGQKDPTGTPYVINPACFAKPGTQGEIGNLQRNLLRNKNIFNTDLAFFKNFRIGEKRSIQLRWEMYNLFNRANFTDINGAMTFAPDSANAKPDLIKFPTNNGCAQGQTLTYTSLCTSNTLGQVSQTSTTFGTPRSTRSPRVMQASIRINF
jgi:hypothetical protein